MERKNISFQYGIHRSPSAANEGELSECINIEAHNGELTPSVMPEIAFTLAEVDKLLFVHQTGNYKNYIIQRGSSLCWFSEEAKDKVNTIGEISPTSIHSVGNTLVIISEDSMEYVLFKSENYKRIGSKPPFCSISFGLESTSGVNTIMSRLGSFQIELGANFIDVSGFISGIKKYHDENVTPSLVSFASDLKEISTENYSVAEKYVSAMTDSIYEGLNKHVANSKKFGAFMHPFYVRYAYRMYDGSHYMHSAPVLMPVNMKGPVVRSKSYETVNSNNFKCYYEIDLPTYALKYSVVGFYDEDMNEVSSVAINDWSDIVSGIDVFVSEPIYPYKQDGYVSGYYNTSALFGSDLCTTGSIFEITPGVVTGSPYKNHLYSDIYPKPELAFIFENNPYFNEQLKEVSPFFKVYEFKDVASFASLAGSNFINTLPIKENKLNALEQQEVLEDDYDSHNKIIPSFAHVYNGRLNISGIRTKQFAGFPMESMVPYTYVPGETNYTWFVRTTLEVEGRTISVVSRSNILLHENPAFVYYPKSKVSEFKIYKYSGRTSGDPGSTAFICYIGNFNGETHKLLNGSFYLSSSFGVSDSYILATAASDPYPTGDPYISHPNKIYTSEVNNPFFFPLGGRNSIGTGDIIAISSNTKAISPGQFGQYPLIVFSTDGVWAMQVGNEGLYDNIHPISKDICTNPNVMQTDGPVIFATQNGLRSVMTEQVVNLSKVLKGKVETLAVPEVDSEYGFLLNTATDDEDFYDFIQNAVFADDYINNRAVIYNPSKDYAYIYCLDCGMFSKMVITKEGAPVRISNVVKAYPEVYMQSGSDIYTFVSENAGNVSKGLIVTRPLAFSDPTAMKVLNAVKLIYRKGTENTKCRYALFVSNDGHNWVQRHSLRGHSFKFFRFAVYTELADTDALQGMSVIFDYRRTNKLR